MHILISNDDGIYSPGLKALAEVADDFGEVRVVAPDVEQSSMGHAITANRPLDYRPAPILKDFSAFRVNGTPADCVALGISQWDKQVDLVLSGINLGLNLGNSVWHSGTVAAAKQALLLGIGAIAFSTEVSDEEPDFENLKQQVAEVLRLLMDRTEPHLYNVNLPRRSRGIAWTKQSARSYDGKMVAATDPMGRRHFWFTVVPLTGPEVGTDRWALEHGETSITPLRLDLTDQTELERLRLLHSGSDNSSKQPYPQR
jgi:5'-nucleotidase